MPRYFINGRECSRREALWATEQELLRHADKLASQLRWSNTSKAMRAALQAGIDALTQKAAALAAQQQGGRADG